MPGGSFDITVDAGAGIIHQDYQGDLCAPKTFKLPLGIGEVDWHGLKCPHAKGDISLDIDIQLSGVIPASLASAKVVVHGSSTSGDKLMCLNMEVSKQLPEVD